MKRSVNKTQQRKWRKWHGENGGVASSGGIKAARSTSINGVIIVSPYVSAAAIVAKRRNQWRRKRQHQMKIKR